MQPTIELTAAAAEHIQQVLAQAGGEKKFRLSVKQTGCFGWAYVPDVVAQPAADDMTIHAADGLTIYLDPACVEMVQGTQIDYIRKELGQKRLVFNNPNVSSECGCGESFNIDATSDE